LSSARDPERGVTLPTLTRIDPDRLPEIGIGKPPSKAGRVAFEKFPIGIDLGGRAVLLYLATDPDVARFRAFVQRHFELLRSLPVWTLRIIVPAYPEGLADPLLEVTHYELTATVRHDVLKILRWYFIERRKVAGGDYEPPNQEEYDDAEEGFRAARFELLYRRWLTDGDRVFELVADGLKTAIDSGAGRIE